MPRAFLGYYHTCHTVQTAHGSIPPFLYHHLESQMVYDSVIRWVLSPGHGPHCEYYTITVVGITLRGAVNISAPTSYALAYRPPHHLCYTSLAICRHLSRENITFSCLLNAHPASLATRGDSAAWRALACNIYQRVCNKGVYRRIFAFCVGNATAAV